MKKIIFCFVSVLIIIAFNGCQSIDNSEKTNTIEFDGWDYEGTILQVYDIGFLFVDDIVLVDKEMSADEAVNRFGTNNVISFYFNNQELNDINVGDRAVVWSSGYYELPIPKAGNALRVEVIPNE